MIDSRRIANRIIKNIPKEPSQLSRLEATSNCESNRSLLIHDEREFNIVADDNTAPSQFFDNDIPADRRELINNATYFKQLSLSFYGSTQPSQKSTLRHSGNSVTKTEPAQDGRSVSPRSAKECFYLWRKSPIMRGEKDSNIFNQNNFSHFDKKNEMTSTSSTKLGSSQVVTKGRESIKRDSVKRDNLRKDGRSTTTAFAKDLKSYKANILKINTNSIRSTPVYQNFATSINMSYSSTPKVGDIASKSTILQMEGRPSLKLFASTKPKPPVKGYTHTESSPVPTKPSISPTLVPKKLKMYAQDKINLSNLKQLVSPESRPQLTRKFSKETLLGRSSVARGASGYQPKRPTLITAGKIGKKHEYYE